LSYLISPKKGCPRAMKICVWTHLGLTKWKTTSKKIKNGRRPQKKWKTTSKKMEDDLKKKGKTTSKGKKGRRPPKNNGKKPLKKWKTT
jgi:hypothetical protein